MFLVLLLILNFLLNMTLLMLNFKKQNIYYLLLNHNKMKTQIYAIYTQYNKQLFY